MPVKSNTRIFFLFTFILFIQLRVSFCQEGKLPVPPNCVWLYGNVFIDKTEISNIHWLEYLWYLKSDSSEAVYKAALPDTSVWLTYQDTAKFEHYFRYPSYRDFPVVGVTNQQAAKYCEWRSDAVNTFIKKSTKKIKKKRGILGDDNTIFRFRLPTEKEWMIAAAGSLDQKIYPYGFVDFMRKSTLTGKPEELYEKTDKSKPFDEFQADLEIFNKGKNEPMFNILKKFENYFIYGEYSLQMITYTEEGANALGVHHMIGNVAEIVAEDGFVKGGGWANTLDESKISIRQRFTKPEAWVGFRCACEVEIISTDK